MLRASVLLIAAGLVGAAPASDKDAKANDLEGSWVATSWLDHGEKLPDLEQHKPTLILKDGKYKMIFDGKAVDEGTYTVDASKNPKELNTTAGAGPQKGMVDRGIYELKGDTLKTAFDEITKQKRPTDFDGSKYQVVEFKRGKE
jgi:uncharacterized protein (TIGR03067 family)